MTQADRFFIPKNIDMAARACELLEVVEVNCKGSLENKRGDYLRWFGPWQCAKMGAVTVAREAQKHLDRLSGYRLFHGACSVKDTARKNRVPYRVITDSNAPAFVNHIRELAPDLIISYSAPQVIKAELLSVPKYGVVNVHGALLPDYRGLLPSFWYLYNDETLGGATVHYMSAKIDDGDILEQGSVDISDCRSMFRLMKKTKALGGELMVRAIEEIGNGAVQPRKNETEKGSYYTWPTVEQAREFRKKGKRLI
jgi:methionyl-tRNA formyltransferase